MLSLSATFAACFTVTAHGQAFSARIPAADPEKYRSVRDAKDWVNPYLIVTASSVEVISKTILSGRKVVPLDRLREALINLPLAARPYGRVAIQPQGLGGSIDRSPVARNVQAAKAVLTALPVVIERWPP